MLTVGPLAQARALFDALVRPIGFVPTMGALHEGHAELVRAARARCASVVVSIFVNPLQFGQNEDLTTYPRDLEADERLLEQLGVDVLFAPDAASMYPPGFGTAVEVGELGGRYEGAVRPTHFRGVTTVVAKLLHIVHPDHLFLGQKDAQQTAVIARMLRDLAFPQRLTIVPTVRDADGLALSSRNAYLRADERARAPSLHRALCALRDALASGSTKVDAIERARATLDPAAQAEYFDVVHAETFEPLDVLVPPAFVIGAARFGRTRLIDNLWIPA